MKKSQLIQLIKEEIGYSRHVPGGKTNGGTTKDFMDIFTAIAKSGQEQDKYKGDPERGNKILDKANQHNVDRITRGEKPIYEAHQIQYSKQDLVWYLGELDQNTQVEIPRIYPGGFSQTEKLRTTAKQAIDQLIDTKLDGKFELVFDKPNYKKFSLVQSDQQKQAIQKIVTGTGKLD